MKAIRHFFTITKHKLIVMKYCFKLGLYWQGLTHDLSKYSITEFWPGVKYYQGNRSPNVEERRKNGYSSAWLHHKGRNRHHFEYWMDYGKSGYVPLEMPRKYVAETLIDRMAACMIYNGKAYTDADPLAYFLRGLDNQYMHPKTNEELKRLLTMLPEKGIDETFYYIRNVYLKARTNLK